MGWKGIHEHSSYDESVCPPIVKPVVVRRDKKIFFFFVGDSHRMSPRAMFYITYFIPSKPMVYLAEGSRRL